MIEVRLNATRELGKGLIVEINGMADDGKLCSIYLHGFRDFDGLPDTDRTRLSLHLHSTFRIYKPAFLHASRTNVDDSCFTKSETTKIELPGFPGVQR
jgi:hypothetical protein